MAAARSAAFIATLIDDVTLTAEATVCYDAMISACPLYAASVRRGTDILNNKLPYIGAAAPVGFDAATRGVYANVEEFLAEPDDAIRAERFRNYIKLIMPYAF